MPEGDVLHRTAVALQRWVGGRVVTDVATSVERFAAGALVGRTVERVESRGKHLLVRFDSGHVLHTHLRMSGSWHVYRAGERWRRPGWQARLTLTCGERLAVCFSAPVVELLRPGAEALHPELPGLGPDVLSDPLDHAEIVRRARLRPRGLPLGELLLDQEVAAGIGNIWRCEALFVEGRHPVTPQSALDDGELASLYATAARLMGANLAPLRRRPDPLRAAAPLDAASGRRWVYRRAGRPCRRCGALVESRRLGSRARTAYWCPSCQPAP